MSIRKLQIDKATREDIENLTKFIVSVQEGVMGNEDDAYLSGIIRQYPLTGVLCMQNLSILMKTYQDAESEIIEHPKWIIEMYKIFKSLDAELESALQFSMAEDTKKALKKIQRKVQVYCDEQ